MAILNEVNEKPYQNVNDDSFYEGHKFVEYGKNIPNVSLIPLSGETINKDKVIITWGIKFQFTNTGIDGVLISVLDLEASLSSGEPINFAEYKFNVFKEKNPESEEIQIYVESVEVDVKNRVVNVVVNI